MHIERDAGTRMAYATAATWAFFLYFLGPATPLIAQQLDLPLQVAGLTGICLAAGLITAGLLGHRVIARWGRRRTGIGAALGLAGGCLALVVAPTFVVILLAVAFSSATGSMLMNVATAALADRHGPSGPRAITEANAAAAWVGLLSPLLIAAAVGIGFGWRAAALVIAITAVVVAGALARVHLTEHPGRTTVFAVADSAVDAEPSGSPPSGSPSSGSPSSGVEEGGSPAVTGAAVTGPSVTGPSVNGPSVTGPSVTGKAPMGPLPAAFSVSLVAVVAAVGTEISLNFWGAVLISDNTGSDLAVATALLSLLIAGIAVGRTLGAGLTRRWSVTRLILGSLLLAGAGFLIVWSATALEVAAVGLFVTGVGFALLFPLTSSVAIGHAHGRTDKAIAIIAVVMGLTMGAAPFALGALAGAVGVTAGFAVVPLLLLVGAGAVVVANRLSGNRVPNGPATHPDR